MNDADLPTTLDAAALRAIWATFLADPAAGWSVGSFGAIGEFTRDPGEPVTLDLAGPRLVARTARGAIAVQPSPGVEPLAWETLRRPAGRWAQGVDFCLPAAEAAMHRRAALTELGPDRDALDPAARGTVLFDIGAAAPNVDACIRVADRALLAVLRAAVGREIVQSAGEAMAAIVDASPVRVFLSRLGRIEVYQPIGRERTPDGPHSHVLPKMLKGGRSHSANLPIPPGRMPALSLYPENPLPLAGDGPFDRVAHARFQALFDRFGPPGAALVKAQLRTRVLAGEAPTPAALAADRMLRTAQRVALRQLAHVHGETPVLRAWRACLEPGGRDGDDPHGA